MKIMKFDLPKPKLKVNIYDLMIFSLSVIAIFGIVAFGPLLTLPQIASAIIAAVVTDLAITYFKEKSVSLPKTAIISGLFIATILEVNNPFYAAIAAVIAMVSKHVIKVKNRNVFNPATFGLIISSIIFPVSFAWWSTSMIPVLVLGLVVATYYKRLHLVLPFLVVYFLLTQVNPISSSYIFFFAFFMLTEPMTSPTRRNGRILYGVVIAIIAAFVPHSDPILVALLVGNALGRIIDVKTKL